MSSAQAAQSAVDLDALDEVLSKGYQGEFRYERPWGFERGIVVGDRTECITTTDERDLSVPDDTDSPTLIAIAAALNAAPTLTAELRLLRAVYEAVREGTYSDRAEGYICDACGSADGYLPNGHVVGCPIVAYEAWRKVQGREESSA